LIAYCWLKSGSDISVKVTEPSVFGTARMYGCGSA
jgi:hypothetical protein